METKEKRLFRVELSVKALKTCPFCGADGMIVHTNAGYNAECGEKNCSIHPHTWYYEKMDEAIEAWNKREGEGK